MTEHGFKDLAMSDCDYIKELPRELPHLTDVKAVTNQSTPFTSPRLKSSSSLQNVVH